MLDAYASYLRALARPDQPAAHRDARTAARTARINAQASIDRMRTEPATPAELLALARALFANGNRLARTAMTLEAVIDDVAALPAQTDIRRFIEHAGDSLANIAAALREQRASDAPSDLRSLQHALVAVTQDAPDRAAGELLARISDRLVDNINALAYAMNRAQPKAAAAVEPAEP